MFCVLHRDSLTFPATSSLFLSLPLFIFSLPVPAPLPVFLGKHSGKQSVSACLHPYSTDLAVASGGQVLGFSGDRRTKAKSMLMPVGNHDFAPTAGTLAWWF